MHYQMLVTTALPDGASSEDARWAVHDALINDDSFCGSGGRFGSPLCDWFEIGGRWSGLLAETLIGPAFQAAIATRFPNLAEGASPFDLSERDRDEYDALWQSVGGIGRSPQTRDSLAEIGHPDDAMILTTALYNALLAKFETYEIVSDGCHCEFVDLDFEPLAPDFVGRKWVVVVDYHN